MQHWTPLGGDDGPRRSGRNRPRCRPDPRTLSFNGTMRIACVRPLTRYLSDFALQSRCTISRDLITVRALRRSGVPLGDDQDVHLARAERRIHRASIQTRGFPASAPLDKPSVANRARGNDASARSDGLSSRRMGAGSGPAEGSQRTLSE